MRFHPTPIAGVTVVEPEHRSDERGSFARLWCARELAEFGLTAQLAQVNLARNVRRGTLRGLHYQASPHAEAKLVRCVRGAVFDVAVDVRPDSATHMQWFGLELSPENDRMLFVPEGCAHGYQVLAGDSEVIYLSSEFYAPEAERGARYDDPAFGIAWPLAEAAILSPKDASWPGYASGEAG
jgi:dTDP-4-dehydrorhamnose 3,5-epimerase